jgi:hypothetical protein
MQITMSLAFHRSRWEQCANHDVTCIALARPKGAQSAASPDIDYDTEVHSDLKTVKTSGRLSMNFSDLIYGTIGYMLVPTV